MKTVEQLGIRPAPWTNICDRFEGGEILDADLESVMVYCDQDEDDWDPRVEASARLMAAAPDLYEALREIVADNKCGLMCSLCGAADKCKLRRAVAALKKAGGAK